jgi:hypothetical protein
MRFAPALCLAVLAAALAGPAHSQETDDSLKVYGVHIVRTPKEPWIGAGIYLGRGFVITAAHVAGLGLLRKPQVEIAGEELPTQVVKDGHFHDVDITLLSVDQRRLPVGLGLRRLALCQSAPRADEPVIVVNAEGTGRSSVMSPHLLQPQIAKKFPSVIRFVPGTGDSGSGIFDASTKCLLGIISGKIYENQVREEDGKSVLKPHDIAKYFVSASVIAQFIPAEVHF